MAPRRGRPLSRLAGRSAGGCGQGAASAAVRRRLRRVCLARRESCSQNRWFPSRQSVQRWVWRLLTGHLQAVLQDGQQAWVGVRVAQLPPDHVKHGAGALRVHVCLQEQHTVT